MLDNIAVIIILLLLLLCNSTLNKSRERLEELILYFNFFSIRNLGKNSIFSKKFESKGVSGNAKCRLEDKTRSSD